MLLLQQMKLSRSIGMKQTYDFKYIIYLVTGSVFDVLSKFSKS